MISPVKVVPPAKEKSEKPEKPKAASPDGGPETH